MKKIFTLISMAMVAMSMNAQTVESYLAVDADGNASAEFAAPATSGTDLIVTAATTNVTLSAKSSRTALDIDNASGAGLNQDTWTNWSDASWSGIKNQGDINFWWIQGTGVPYISFVAEQKMKDGEPLDEYKANYTLYLPDGTNGLPVSGEYLQFTFKVDGTMKIGIWANKGNRQTFFVESESKKACTYLVEGYINGQNDGEGKKRWLTNDEILQIHNDGNQADPWVIGAGNQAFWGNLTVDVQANKTYWLFQGNSQIGFQGFEFTPAGGTGIENVKTAQSNNAPMYNLAGQKVNSNFKGIAIQNGKKMIVK